MSVIVHGPVEVTRKVDCGDVALLDYNCSQSTVIVSICTGLLLLTQALEGIKQCDAMCGEMAGSRQWYRMTRTAGIMGLFGILSICLSDISCTFKKIFQKAKCNRNR